MALDPIRPSWDKLGVSADFSSDQPDTALARLLHDQGSVKLGALQSCLAEVRRRRVAEPEITFAALLIQGQLASREVVNAGLRCLGEEVLGGERLPTTSLNEAPSLPRRVGPYLVVSELARGGMGAVYEVIDEQTDTHYALKTILSSFGAVPSEDLDRFRREAEVMAKLRHPNVARIHAAHAP